DKSAEVTKAPEAPKIHKPATFAQSPQRFPPNITNETMEKVKHSSALIKVAASGGVATGSGWFAEPGIIVTNSHVVGMSEAAESPPDWIKVVLDSGTPTERTLDAKLLGLDRDN